MRTKINWVYFPKYRPIPKHLIEIVDVFKEKHTPINSETNHLASNEVLLSITEELQNLGYKVETGKKRKEKIEVPVLYGTNGTIEKGFDADAVNIDLKTVIEVEAGRAVTNYQFLKDLFQSMVMIDIEYLVIAVRNSYRKKKDFEMVERFLDVLYSSDRFHVPLKGILIVGY
jgi:pyruvate-formate lyase-activating enzyme